MTPDNIVYKQMRIVRYQESAKKILKMFHKLRRPIFLGVISLEIGRSLLHTEEIVNTMLDEGLLRPLTQEELNVLGAETDTKVYVLTGRFETIFAYD